MKGREPSEASDEVDLLGVGFGPSNLALAIAIRELEGAPHVHPLRSRFFEKKARFGWHRGMLIDGATMQVSFLKDLVTLRNPTSDFSYLSFLQDRGRLVDFVNHKALFPSRREFHDYLVWAATRLAHLVDYGCEVTAVRPIVADGVVEALEVVIDRTSDGANRREVVRCRNLVLAQGLRPKLPPGVQRSPKVWHSAELLDRLSELDGVPRRLAVVGSGQSAAEVVAHLHERFQDAEVHSVFGRYGYCPSDDSPFVNQIFDPTAVDEFYNAPEEVKASILSFHGNTNYSVVDGELIDELYRRAYQEKVSGQARLHVHRCTRLDLQDEDAERVSVALTHLPTGERRSLNMDVVVFATGYAPSDPQAILGDLVSACLTDREGRLRVERDYRVATAERVRCGIYLQGCTEYSHGISSSLLSNTAVRAGEIVSSIQARQARVARKPLRDLTVSGGEGSKHPETLNVRSEAV